MMVNTPGTVPRGGVEDPQAGFTSESFALAPGESREFTTSLGDLTQATENTATVTCEIVGAGGGQLFGGLFGSFERAVTAVFGSANARQVNDIIELYKLQHNMQPD